MSISLRTAVYSLQFTVYSLQGLRGCGFAAGEQGVSAPSPLPWWGEDEEYESERVLPTAIAESGVRGGLGGGGGLSNFLSPNLSPRPTSNPFDSLFARSELALSDRRESNGAGSPTSNFQFAAR